MGRPVIYTDEQKLRVQELFENTDMTLDEIGADVDLTYGVIWKLISTIYTPETRLARKRQSYRNSKLGELNPSYGKSGKDAYHYKTERVADGHGYYQVLRPEWYTGRVGQRYVFEHNVVMCEALGITEMPAGFVVHHVDGDKTNNNINNLALLTISAHARLHGRERVTTISKESRG